MPESKNDDGFLFRGLGWLPVSLGAIVIALGTIYVLNEWRFGGAIFAWSLMWGLMLVGVGLAFMSPGRLAMALGGLVACVASAYLVFRWEKHVALTGWAEWIYPADALGGAAALIALAAFIRSRLRSSSRSADRVE
jgi:hypothetical protein